MSYIELGMATSESSRKVATEPMRHRMGQGGDDDPAESLICERFLDRLEWVVATQTNGDAPRANRFDTALRSLRTTPSQGHRSLVDPGDDLEESGYRPDRYEHDELRPWVPVDDLSGLLAKRRAFSRDVGHHQVLSHIGQA